MEILRAEAMVTKYVIIVPKNGCLKYVGRDYNTGKRHTRTQFLSLYILLLWGCTEIRYPNDFTYYLNCLDTHLNCDSRKKEIYEEMFEQEMQNLMDYTGFNTRTASAQRS